MKHQFQLIFLLLKLFFLFQHPNIKCLDVIVPPNFCQPLSSCANPNVDTRIHRCYALNTRCCSCSKLSSCAGSNLSSLQSCQPLLSCANPNVDTNVHCCYALDIRCCCIPNFNSTLVLLCRSKSQSSILMAGHQG